MKKPAEVQIAEALDTSVNAKTVLESAAFQKAFEDLQAQYTLTWRNSKAAEAQLREDAYYMLRALDELKGNLKAAAAAGGIVTFNLRRSITSKSA
jgi:hypothetical protein